jgi:hypothetical protein
MTKPILTLLGTCAATFAASLGQAQTVADSASRLSLEPATTNLNRLSLAYRMGLNLNVRFKNFGAFSGPLNASLTGGQASRNYDDGYNRVDSNNNQHGPGYENTTWNWGYDNASQISYSGGQPVSVTMHNSSSAGTTSPDRSDDPAPGFELTYDRELLRNEHWHGGLEAAFGFTDMDINDSSPLNVGINQISDTYAVPAATSGQGLPSPGYGGSYKPVSGGSNPVISSLPSRSTATLPGVVTGSRHFDADIFGFRFGPYVEVPLSEKVEVALSGGFALAYVDSDFSFNETLTYAGGTLTRSGSGTQSSLLPGGYISGMVSAQVAENWSAFAGAQFEDFGTYTQEVNGRKAVLDLSQAVFVTLGLTYSF